MRLRKTGQLVIAYRVHRNVESIKITLGQKESLRDVKKKPKAPEENLIKFRTPEGLLYGILKLIRLLSIKPIVLNKKKKIFYSPS